MKEQVKEMSQPFNAVKITDDVYWVGAIDWGLRDFHGYATERGSTYNAYLVVADKIALIDAVKGPFFEEMMSRIRSVIDPSRIDYIISNHAEMDHSGCLFQTADLVKPEKLFASSNGVKALKAHFHTDHEITTITEGQTLSLGNRTLRFIETRLLHWPDSMFTYLEEERMLFSQDGFGMHLATTERFADEIDPSILEFEAAKYYANILLPFSPMVLNTLKKAEGLAIDMILPDHGPIWRKDLGYILGRYHEWATQKPTAKALVVYDTMWGSTENMANAIIDGLVSEGIHASPMHLRAAHRSNIATAVLGAGALIIGSPTLNGGMFPTVADALTYLKGLKPKNLIGATFGSYGWSGEATKHIREIMDSMQLEMVGDPLKIQYVPDNDALVLSRNLGINIANALKQKL